MAMCPLLGKECIGEQCTWWHKWEEDCVSAILPARITDVGNHIVENLPQYYSDGDSKRNDTENGCSDQV